MPEDTTAMEVGTDQNPIVVKPEKPYEKPIDLIAWRSTERVFKKRSPVWFVTFIFLALIALVILLIMKQWTIVLGVLALAFVVLAMNKVEPPLREYAVTTTGIKIGSKPISYADLKWFWFEDEDEDEILNIATYLDFPHIVSVQMPKEENTVLRDRIEVSLLKYLPYHEEKNRDMFKWLDRIILKLEPYLPQSVVAWYANTIDK